MLRDANYLIVAPVQSRFSEVDGGQPKDVQVKLQQPFLRVKRRFLFIMPRIMQIQIAGEHAADACFVATERLFL